MPDLLELKEMKAVIESFAPKTMPSPDKPFRIGKRLVDVWVIPVSYEPNEQLIEVRKV